MIDAWSAVKPVNAIGVFYACVPVCVYASVHMCQLASLPVCMRASRMSCVTESSSTTVGIDRLLRNSYRSYLASCCVFLGLCQLSNVNTFLVTLY